MPMIVTHNAIPVTRCPMASHRPANTNQTTLPMTEGAPAPGWRSIVRPNGHSA